MYFLQNHDVGPPANLMDLISQDTPNSWLQHFQNYLQSHQMEKTLHLLDYVIDCQTIFSDKFQSKAGKLTFVFDTYLHEDCPKPVMLTNQILRDELVCKLSQVRKQKDTYDLPTSEYTEALNLLKDSINDYKIWKGGVEQAYKQYLSTKPRLPSNTMTTALLTILWTTRYCLIKFDIENVL